MPRADSLPCLVMVQSISRGDGGKAHALSALVLLNKAFAGQPQRPDLEALVAS
eukprot:COSAG06_NODE_26038_length_623_cov_0.906489_1_plen_52_part_10